MLEFTLLWAALIGVAALWAAVRLLDRDGAISAVAPDPFDSLLGAAIGGLVIGRLWAMIADGVNPLTNLGDIILVRAGVDTLGASLGAAAVLAFLYRRDLPHALDAVAAPALVGLAGWHAGCLAREACSTDAGPIEVYAAVGLLVAAVVTWRLWRTGAAGGTATGVALLQASGVRLVTEPSRYHLGNGQVMLYVAGVFVGATVIVVATLWDRLGRGLASDR